VQGASQLVESEYVPQILSAPQFVTVRVRARLPDDLPAATPLTVRREDPQ